MYLTWWLKDHGSNDSVIINKAKKKGLKQVDPINNINIVQK